MQVKLLRVLQEKEFEPLGAISAVQTDVRVIAATKNVLSEMVNDGTFRDDLFFRLNVVKLELPLLRERRDDIPILVEHFIEKFNHKMRRRIESVSGNVLQLLMQYDFPGNIRELENIIEHAFVMCRGEIIQLHHLPIEFSQRKPTNPLNQQEPMPLQAAEQHLLREVLEKHDWNKVATAKELGVHRATLYRKMKKHGL